MRLAKWTCQRQFDLRLEYWACRTLTDKQSMEISIEKSVAYAFSWIFFVYVFIVMYLLRCMYWSRRTGSLEREVCFELSELQLEGVWSGMSGVDKIFSVAPVEVLNLPAIADYSLERDATKLLNYILRRDVEGEMSNWDSLFGRDKMEMKLSVVMSYGDKCTLLIRCSLRNDSVFIHDPMSLTFLCSKAWILTFLQVRDSNNLFRNFRILSFKRLVIAYLMKSFDRLFWQRFWCWAYYWYSTKSLFSQLEPPPHIFQALLGLIKGQSNIITPLIPSVWHDNSNYLTLST